MRYTPELYETDGVKYISKDYALIFNIENPYCEKARIIVIAGCMTIGEGSSCKFISKLDKSDPIHKKLRQFLKKHPTESFYCILEVRAMADSYGDCKIVCLDTLEKF
jgi:hypothetical protein